MPSFRAAANARLLNRPPRFVISSRPSISPTRKSWTPARTGKKEFGLILWSREASRKRGRVRGTERRRVAAPARRRGCSQHLPLPLGRARHRWSPRSRSLPPAGAEGLRGTVRPHLPARESGPAEAARRRAAPRRGAGLFPLRSSALERRAASYPRRRRAPRGFPRFPPSRSGPSRPRGAGIPRVPATPAPAAARGGKASARPWRGRVASTPAAPRGPGRAQRARGGGGARPRCGSPGGSSAAGRGVRGGRGWERATSARRETRAAGAG